MHRLRPRRCGPGAALHPRTNPTALQRKDVAVPDPTQKPVTTPESALRSAVEAEVAAVEAQLGRIDTKAGLLGLTGAASTATPLYVTGAHLPIMAAAIAWLAARRSSPQPHYSPWPSGPCWR